jgi:hypothetical protein
MRVLRAKAHDYFGGRGCGVELTAALAGGAAGWSLRRLWRVGLRAEAHDYFGGWGCGVEWLWRLRWLVVLRRSSVEICGECKGRVAEVGGLI